MPEGVAALIGALLLFLLPVNWKNREFTISWGQATKIDWGTLLLFGGGITLGNLMFESKLAEAVGSGLLALSGASSLWGITFGAIFIAILVSETSSNTASANMVIPVMISLAGAAGESNSTGHRRHSRSKLGVHAASLHSAQRVERTAPE